MRVKIMPLAIAALIACSAFGQPSPDQTVDKVFHFANTTLPQGRAEITNAIRTIAAIQKASVDNGASVLAVSGTAGQIAMAEWLFFEMDKPADAPPPKVAPVEFRVAGAADDVARVFYLVNSPTPQAAQEIVNTIRSLAEIQRILVYNAPKAVAMRGTALGGDALKVGPPARVRPKRDVET